MNALFLRRRERPHCVAKMRYFPPTPDLNTQGIYSDDHTHHFPQLKMSLREEESDGRYGGVGKDGGVGGRKDE